MELEYTGDFPPVYEEEEDINLKSNRNHQMVVEDEHALNQWDESQWFLELEASPLLRVRKIPSRIWTGINENIKNKIVQYLQCITSAIELELAINVIELCLHGFIDRKREALEEERKKA